MLDGSIEPPFLIGMTCGACHIAFNPLKPPKDPEHPAWENIDGLVGNQYSRMSEVMASGMPESSLEWQIFSHAARDRGYVSGSQRSNQQPGHDESAHQPRAAPRSRAGHQVAAGEHVRGRIKRACVLVRAGQGRQVLAAIATDRAGASHPQGWRRQHRRARGGPARLLQHRFLLGAVLGESHHRPATGRSEAPRLRPDAVRHRPVPARLPQFPRHRRSAAEHRRFPVHRQACRSVSRARSRLAGGARQARWRVRAERGRPRRTIFAETCARCHSSTAGPWDGSTDFHATVPGTSGSARRLPQQREAIR